MFIIGTLFLSQDLLSQIPQSIRLYVPTTGTKDKDFTALTTQTYGWAQWGKYRRESGNEEGTSNFILCEVFRDLIVDNTIDIEDLPYTDKHGGNYSDSGEVALVWRTEYTAALTVSSSTSSLWDNHALVSNWEITGPIP